jgi:NAD(P)-dependent dehydrogenase (short-subunit alcohol dehydrogenase family)
LQAAGRARVVSTASLMHKGNTLDFSDLQMERSFNGMTAYGKSKLCNILFTRELARRWTGSGITANCLHPGYVDTRFGDQSGTLLAIGNRIGKLFAISPEKGARTIVYLASSPTVADASGGYFYQCKQQHPSRQAQDDAMAKRLWEVSEQLSGVNG